MPRPEKMPVQTREAERELSKGTPEEAEKSGPQIIEQKVGTTVETRSLQKRTVRDIFAGAVMWGKEKLNIFARKNGEAVKMRAVTSEQARAEQKAKGQLDLFLDVFESDLNAASKVSGGSTENLEAALSALEARAPEIIASAVGTENPESAIIEQIQEGLHSSAEGETSPTLGELELEYAQIASRADEAFKQEKKWEYEKAILEMAALQYQINNLRLKRNQDATPQEIEQIADDVEGFVEPLPDTIYDNGYDSVVERIAQLEQQMETAQSEKDSVSYVVAEDERKRHMVMLPLLERVKTLELIQQEAETALRQTQESGKNKRKLELGMKKAQRDTWRNTVENIQDQLAQMDAVVAELGTRGIKEGDGQKREDLEANYARAHERMKKLETEVLALQTESVDIKFDPEQKIDGAKTALYRKLKDLYADDQAQVEIYIERALSLSNTSESTKAILGAFKSDVINRRPLSEESPIPEETSAELSAQQETLEEGKIDLQEVKKSFELANELKDLHVSGVIENKTELDTWKNTFAEVVYALNKLGLSPKDEGLAESFESLMDTKDRRGFIGKMFGKKTDRVKAFEKLAQVHYQYIDSGKVDMTEYLANAKTRGKTAEKQMGAGTGGFTV